MMVHIFDLDPESNGLTQLRCCALVALINENGCSGVAASNPLSIRDLQRCNCHKRPIRTSNQSGKTSLGLCNAMLS